MADVHDPKTRSFNMSRIRSKNTRPELIVRKYLFANSFRFRLHDNKLPGTPDIVLKKYKTVIFVHGCFWHGHSGCKYFKIPQTRTQLWEYKINNNKKLDEKRLEELMEMGWKVIIVWECELKSGKKDDTLENINRKLRADENSCH